MSLEVLHSEQQYRQTALDTAKLEFQIAQSVVTGRKDHTYKFLDRHQRLIGLLTALQEEVDAEIAGLSKKPNLKRAA